MPPIPKQLMIHKPECDNPFLDSAHNTPADDNEPNANDMSADIAKNMIGKNSFSTFVHNSTDLHIQQPQRSILSSLQSSIHKPSNKECMAIHNEKIMEALPVAIDTHNNTSFGSGDQTDRPRNLINEFMHNGVISNLDEDLVHVDKHS